MTAEQRDWAIYGRLRYNGVEGFAPPIKRLSGHLNLCNSPSP